MAESKVPPGPLDRDNNPGEYVVKTCRSAALVATILSLYLAGSEQYAVILPMLVGVALGGSLLWTWSLFATSLFTPQSVREKKRGRKSAIFLFALIKYPLVAYLIYWATRHWDQKQLLWFVGGFILFQAVIVLRALGRSLTEKNQN